MLEPTISFSWNFIWNKWITQNIRNYAFAAYISIEPLLVGDGGGDFCYIVSFDSFAVSRSLAFASTPICWSILCVVPSINVIIWLTLAVYLYATMLLLLFLAIQLRSQWYLHFVLSPKHYGNPHKWFWCVTRVFFICWFCSCLFLANIYSSVSDFFFEFRLNFSLDFCYFYFFVIYSSIFSMFLYRSSTFALSKDTQFFRLLLVFFFFFFAIKCWKAPTHVVCLLAHKWTQIKFSLVPFVVPFASIDRQWRACECECLWIFMKMSFWAIYIQIISFNDDDRARQMKKRPSLAAREEKMRSERFLLFFRE